jgi:uncharacterized membrane protein
MREGFVPDLRSADAPLQSGLQTNLEIGMTALALAAHIFGAVVWVGGMFAIYVCLRPALSAVDPPQRLRLLRITFQNFFPWVWAAVLLLLVSGYWMVFVTFGGFSGARLHVHLMQFVGWVMIALFVWLFHDPWLAFKHAVDADDWHPLPVRTSIASGASLRSTCRLGLLVVIIGASSRYWG